MHKRIDLKSRELQNTLGEIARIGGQQKVSIRLQRYEEELQCLDLTIPYTQVRQDSPQPGTGADDSTQGHDEYLLDGPVAYDTMPQSDSIYLVSSYTKPIVNFLMLLALKEKGLSLDNDACEIYNRYRGKSNNPRLPIVSLHGKTTIRQLLCHQRAFPPMNELIFAPDGSCLLTMNEFLLAASLAAKNDPLRKGLTKGEVIIRYSNANHIFAAIIIELIMEQSFKDVCRDLIFIPLAMNQSSFGPFTAEGSGHSIEAGLAFQVSASGSVFSTHNHTRLQDTVETAALGLRSSPGDIAKFNYALLCALEGRRGNSLSEDDVKNYLTSNRVSLAGLWARVLLDTPTLTEFESQSPHTHLNPESHQYRSMTSKCSNCPPAAAKKCVVHYKSGYFDGFSCAVYLIPPARFFFIVMGNSMGPLDSIHYISWHLLQELFAVRDRVDVKAEATLARRHCSQRLAALENTNLLRSNDTVALPELVGTYRHDLSGQQMTITADGDVIFHGAVKRSSTMKMARIDDDNIRVLLNGPVLTIEGWSSWANMDFYVKRNASTVSLNREFTIGQDTHRYEYRRSPG